MEEAVPAIYKALHEKGVEVRGDERTREIVPEIVPATEEDWGTEYLDAIISREDCFFYRRSDCTY